MNILCWDIFKKIKFLIKKTDYCKGNFNKKVKEEIKSVITEICENVKNFKNNNK